MEACALPFQVHGSSSSRPEAMRCYTFTKPLTSFVTCGSPSSRPEAQQEAPERQPQSHPHAGEHQQALPLIQLRELQHVVRDVLSLAQARVEGEGGEGGVLEGRGDGVQRPLDEGRWEEGAERGGVEDVRGGEIAGSGGAERRERERKGGGKGEEE